MKCFFLSKNGEEQIDDNDTEPSGTTVDSIEEDENDEYGIEDNFLQGVNTSDDSDELPIEIDERIGTFLLLCRRLVDTINQSSVISSFSFTRILIQEVYLC